MNKYANLSRITELDRLAMEEFGLDILQMMEIAGNRFAEIVKESLGSLRGKKILVISGVGNNGGDGLSCARYLSNWGAHVMVVLAKSELKPPARHHMNILEKMGMSPEVDPKNLPDADLIVDALLGYNQKGDAKAPFDGLIKLANKQNRPIIAFDNPSGLNIESGEATNPTIRADETVTLAVVKQGLVESSAEEYVGKIHLVDLGIPKEAYEIAGLEYPFDKSEEDFIL